MMTKTEITRRQRAGIVVRVAPALLGAAGRSEVPTAFGWPSGIAGNQAARAVD